MRSSTKWPINILGKLSLIFITLASMAWLFVNNAQNCLARDFVEKAPHAVCWRVANDYESTIGNGQDVLLVLLVLAIICSSISATRYIIRRTNNSQAENKKTAVFITIFSAFLLAFIITAFNIYQKTTFNNNNYFLNTATDAVIKIGSPIWLVTAAAAATYWSKVVRSKAAE